MPHDKDWLSHWSLIAVWREQISVLQMAPAGLVRSTRLAARCGIANYAPPTIAANDVLHRPTRSWVLAHHRLRVTKSSRITFVTFPSNVMVSLFSRMLSTLPSPNIG